MSMFPVPETARQIIDQLGAISTAAPEFRAYKALVTYEFTMEQVFDSARTGLETYIARIGTPLPEGFAVFVPMLELARQAYREGNKQKGREQRQLLRNEFESAVLRHRTGP